MNITEKLELVRDCKSDIKDAIEAKGVTVGDVPFDQYASKIEAIPTPIEEAPENDVNFYDYDGFRVASYTIAEAKALTSLPTPPSHEGLTFQEWNWSLADIQGYNRQYIDIGANYVPTDGKTHLFICTSEPNQLFSFTLQVRDLTDGAVVDWGDGSATETVAMYGDAELSHTFADKGYHEITIFSAQLVTREGYRVQIVTSGNTYPWNALIKEIWFAKNAFQSKADAVANCKVALPNNLDFSYFRFNTCSSIPFITFPRNFVIGQQAVLYQTNAKVSFPKTTTTLNPSYTITMVFCCGRMVLPEVTDGNTTNYLASKDTSIISIPLSYKASAANFLNSPILSYIDIVEGWVPNISLTLSGSKYWSPDNLVRFFTKLGTTQTAITLTFGSTNLNKLTAEEKAIATAKGYTLA